MNLRYIVADEIGHFASVFFDIMTKIYEGEEYMIEKLTLRTRAYILTDKRFENFISSPGDWFYAEKDDEKVIVKSISKRIDKKYRLLLKKEILEKVKNNVNVIIGCIDDDKFYRLELEIKNFDADKEVLFNDKFEICKNKDSVTVTQKNMIDLNIESFTDYADNDRRINSLATADRIKGFGGRDEFLNWYNSQDKKCCYCGVEESDLIRYFDKKINKQYEEARPRGKFLEVERVITAPESENKYSKENCRLACYICNNAKSDFLSAESFEPIARGINKFWNNYLNKNVEFPENFEYWSKNKK
jgi:hypothetical protein